MIYSYGNLGEIAYFCLQRGRKMKIQVLEMFSFINLSCFSQSSNELYTFAVATDRQKVYICSATQLKKKEEKKMKWDLGICLLVHWLSLAFCTQAINMYLAGVSAYTFSCTIGSKENIDV